MLGNYAPYITPTTQSQGFSTANANNLSAVPYNNLQSAQLYNHPVVKTLWDSQQAMLRVYSQSQKENSELKEEIRELRRELQEQVDRHSSERSSRYPPNMSADIYRSPSLTPSDSISQAGRTRTPSMNSITPPCGQSIPANRNLPDRPPHYPSSILWHLQDCQREPGLVTRATKSRPSMERCIRHPNGRPVVRSEWRRMMTSAKQVIQEVLRPLSPADEPLNTRTFYKGMHPDAWQSAVGALEAKEPLTALCAFHWKAEHVLGQMLVSKRSVEVRVAQYNESRKVSTSGGCFNAYGHPVMGGLHHPQQS